MAIAKRGNEEIPKKEPKGSARQLSFLKYYLSGEIGGNPNPYFGNAYRSAKKVGYSDSYARKILTASSKQNSANDVVRLASEQIRKHLSQALEEKGIGSDYIATLLKRLGEKNDKRNIDKRLIDTGDPDSFAAKVALDFIARVTGMYDAKPDPDELAGYSKEQLIEVIIR